MIKVRCNFVFWRYFRQNYGGKGGEKVERLSDQNGMFDILAPRVFRKYCTLVSTKLRQELLHSQAVAVGIQ